MLLLFFIMTVLTLWSLVATSHVLCMLFVGGDAKRPSRH